MGDLILAFVVVIAPTVFAIGIEVIDKGIREHPYWRFGIIVFGLILSGLTWLQLSRESVAREAAIRETSKDVAAETSKQVTAAVTEQFKQTVADQQKKIDLLQAKLDAQGKDVAVIKSSNIVTGKNPVKVEVTNPPTESDGSFHPVISVISTRFKKEDDKKKLSWTITLANTSKFPANATVQAFWYWNDRLIPTGYGPTELAFAPPPANVELSKEDMTLTPDAYALFLAGTGKLTVKVVAVYADDYPNKGGSTTYTFAGRAQPDLGFINITATNWTVNPK